MKTLRMPRLWMGLFAAAAIIVAMPPHRADAEVTIDITRGTVDPLPIAVAPFKGSSAAQAEIAQQMTDVIVNDLRRSGLFAPIDPKAFIQRDLDDKIRPRFGDWRVINAQALVTGSAVAQDDGKIAFSFVLWDVFAEQELRTDGYSVVPDGWRRVAHIIADDIYEKLTGESGYFDSRVVYVAESGPAKTRVKRLAIMDQDGANHKFLTNGESLVLTPRFSPTRQEITYLSFYNDRPRVYLFNLQTGRRELLGDFQGMTYAPRFSADGNAVVMSYTLDGNSEVALLDLRTRQSRRLTNNPNIDTSPSFSPDGNQIVFNSDRGGSPQLYVMEADGSNVRRISFGQGRYTTPVWSPRGDWIAFTKQRGGQFYIGVMRPDGSGERLLTEAWLDEGPTWSPNGRVLMFFRQPGPSTSPKLYSVDLTGYNLREVVTPGDASDPAWSPLNQ